jgi:gas vesicle protein
MGFLKTLFRGFLLGVGVGVLVAPRAGEETRRLLSEKFNTLMDGASDVANKLDYSSAEGGTSAAVVPKQDYAESTASREIGADATSI